MGFEKVVKNTEFLEYFYFFCRYLCRIVTF